MPRLQARSFANPDDVRTLPRIHFATVVLGEATVGHCRFDPGWQWSSDVGPLVGTATCGIRHLGYSMSGTVRVVMNDGQTLDIGPDTVFEVPPGHDKWVVGDEPWEAIEWGQSGQALAAALQDAGSRALATVVFTDIVDSTARLERLGDTAWRELLGAHNRRLREVLNIHRGREVKTTGDGFLAVFESPARAVRCGADMTRSLGSIDLQIRVAVHTGEVEVVGDDVRGIAVHTAARILGVAGGGEVVVSAATAALLEGSGLVFEDAGMHELKGLTGARRVFRLADTEGGGASVELEPVDRT
jgi:class 3 adenylate cyclase